MKTIRLTILTVTFLLQCHIALAQGMIDHEILIHFNKKPQRVIYKYYIPQSADSNQKLPVCVCLGGLPFVDGQYLPSGRDVCLNESWIQFSEQNQFAILGIGFLFKPEDWKSKTSYQYPQIWSGEALNQILNRLSEVESIDENRLMIFGISAGAQFALRYALMHPDRTQAVAAHISGGYDEPKEFIPTKFLITVGEFDNDEIKRVDFAKLYTDTAKRLGIDVTLKVIDDIGHSVLEEQHEMSRQFFMD